ncbi:MAG: LLM class F420-dependent oxidoreductase [Alphaproteobacteria bacterium]|nr:LLM class F420-dependent oxidoreductase [Alphaproteobacteria bacterium]
MKLGIFSYNTDYGIRPDVLARELEARGYESLWVGEHTHIPASRDTPYPGGEPLPKPYYHMADPFVSLMAAAAVTEKLVIGTGICLMVERDPITTAKEVATLDRLSDGRFLFGIGGGWNAEEMENHGTPFARRWKVLRERVEAMQAIWTQEEASYSGEFVNFEAIISHPKPMQTPYPPVIMGSATGDGRQRVADYCDGWIPIDVLLEDLPEAIADLGRRAEAAGRDPASISVSVFAFDGANEAALKRYRELDIERVVLVCPRRDDDALPFLDSFAPLIPDLA